MSVVLVHEPCRSSVKPGHRVHRALITLSNVVLGNDQLDPEIQWTVLILYNFNAMKCNETFLPQIAIAISLQGNRMCRCQIRVWDLNVRDLDVIAPCDWLFLHI